MSPLLVLGVGLVGGAGIIVAGGVLAFLAYRALFGPSQDRS